MNFSNIDLNIGKVIYRPVRVVDYAKNIKSFIPKKGIFKKKNNKYFIGEEEIHKTQLFILYLFLNENDCLSKCDEFIHDECKNNRLTKEKKDD